MTELDLYEIPVRLDKYHNSFYEYSRLETVLLDYKPLYLFSSDRGDLTPRLSLRGTGSTRYASCLYPNQGARMMDPKSVLKFLVAVCPDLQVEVAGEAKLEDGVVTLALKLNLDDDPEAELEFPVKFDIESLLD